VVKERTYQIGEVAERVGLSLRTVRYYEEMGLLSPEGRTDGGFRLYTEAHVERLALIKQMKPLGFTVHEMAELLSARDKLASRRVSDATRAGAQELLAEYADRAADRCDELREHLTAAEAFAKQMAREARRSQAPVAQG
jgi:MerR family copper efflux transcriptional regulator